MELFKDYVLLYSYSGKLFKPTLKGYTLNAFEDFYKCLDLYYSFSKNMGYQPDLVWLKETKMLIAERINKELLSHSTIKKRRCRQCNRPLGKNEKSDICFTCLKKLRDVSLDVDINNY